MKKSRLKKTHHSSGEVFVQKLGEVVYVTTQNNSFRQLWNYIEI